MSRFVLTAQLQLQAPNNVGQIVQQIQNQLNGVNVNVQIQGSAQAQRQLAQINQQCNQATSAAERMGRAFALSIRRFAAFSIATRAVGLFTSTLNDAVQTSINFERQLIKVAQVTGKSVGQLRGLTKQITGLSTGLGVASSDLLEVSTILAQAGLTADDTSKALRTLAKAALAPNFDSMSETAEGAIAILAQFQEGVGALEKQLGSINAVAGAFAVEASDLIDVVRRTGGVFKSSGGSLNELLALFTSVRATTRESAESIGTGLRTIFTRIQRPKTIEYLKQFGVELVDLNGKFVGPYEAVKRLSEALSGLGEGDITFIKIAEELGGFRQIGKVLPLLQQFSTAQSALNVAMKAGDSLTQDAASAQAALAVRIMKVKEEFLALIRSVTETSTFQIMANSALSLASALIKIADSIKPLLPMLAALGAIRLARGMGNFFGGMMSGATSGRTYNKGGKVLGFARGGLVPGSGDGDTVPAMLAPGEFVIRKSSVNKLGAGNLAAMNENRYAAGGIALQNRAGMAIPDTFGDNSFKSSNIPVNLSDIASATPQSGPLKSGSLSSLFSFKNTKTVQANRPNVLPAAEFKQALQTVFGFASKTYIGKTAGVSSTQKTAFTRILTEQMQTAIKNGASQWSNSVGVPLSPDQITFGEKFNLAPGLAGSFFESVVDAFQGRPIGEQASENKRPFDFIAGLRNGANSKLFANLSDVDYIDAKKSASLATDSEYKKKIASQLAIDGYDEVKNAVYTRFSSLVQQRNLGGIIQKFANGGMAIAPLIDDILKNASGSLLPQPSSAIASLIKAGGGAIDIDRTLKRTIGDKAYGNAKTDAQRQAVLGKYFKGDNRLNDIQSAPLTTFGKELQAAIKSGQLMPGKLSIISKSQRTPGVAEYLSQLFGIPVGNMIFTQGGSKQPAMDALRNKGPRAMRKFATGGDTGTDTVPALLTPGEFVINRASAQRIGYGNLNRMNKIGKYAKGGVVQHFASGGAAGNAAASIAATTDSIIGQLNAKDAAIVKDSMKKNSDTFDKLTKEMQDLLFMQEEIQAAYKAMARALKSGVSAEEAHRQALVAADAKLNAGKGGTGMQSATNVALREANIQSQINDENAKSKYGQYREQYGPLGKSKDVIEQERAEKTAKRNMQKNQVGSRWGASGGGGGSFGGIMKIENVGGAAIAMSMVTASLQAMLPPLDENSSVLTKLSHSFLGLITTLAGVALALQSFGVSLNSKSIMNFFSGKGALSANAQQGLFSTARGLGVSKNIAGNIVGVANGLVKFLGPVALATGALLALNSAAQMVADEYKKQAEKDIKAGNVESAGKNAGKGEFISAAGVSSVIGGIIGAAVAGIPSLGIGTAAGAVGGAAVGASVGMIIDKFTGLSAQASNLAMAQAGEVRSSMALEKASQNAALAMDDFKNGTKSALDVLNTFQPAANERNIQRQRTDSVVQDATAGKVGNISGFLRGTARVLTLGAAGYAGLESGKQYNERLSKNSVESVRSRREAESKLYGSMSESRNMAIRSGFARGSNREEIEAQLQSRGVETSGQLLSRSFAVRRQAATAKASGDTALETELTATADMLEQQSKEMENAFKNIELEVKRAKDAFDALNLGLRSSAATSAALSATMNKFAAGFEVGGSKFVSDVEFLQESLSSAAQAMNPEDIKDAVKGVSSNLRDFGVSEKYIEKFEGNISAFVTAQANYNKAFDDIKKSIVKGDYQGMNPAKLKERFADELTKDMKDGGAKDNLKKVISSLELSDTEVDKILGGDLSVFGDKLSEAQKKMIDDIQKIAQERAKAEQVLIDLTKKKIDAERNLVQATQEAIDLAMEGRELQAKYGGKSVNTTEKGNSILLKSNAESSRLGLTNLRTGSVAELRQRNAEIARNFSDVESRRRVQGGMDKTAGVKADEFGKDLEKAYKTQVETIRSLIKLEEEQLKITQEKNKLDKESMESLIKGDVEEFFKKQAAVGATAAIASGDNRLQNYYGADALGMAYQDIQRQQEAGVQSLYGQDLAGRGGLTERAASAALSSRGINDMRAVQVMAGTTGEEEASKARLRELGGLLGETGEVGRSMAEMQVTTQTVILNAAQLKFDDVMNRGNQRAVEAQLAEGKARGGLIYASRGIFVPRGTDTVPAMLTPGEFVVNRGAVQRGNNLQILQAMNGSGSVSNTGGAIGMSGGGTVRYFSGGGENGPANGGSSNNVFGIINSLVSAMSGFSSSLAKNIEALTKTTISIKLDATNVNVNINDGGLLSKIKDETKLELFQQIKDKLVVGNNGKLTERMQ